jgi:hypothetical protein
VITPLLWALGSSLKISNRSLLALVAQGYKGMESKFYSLSWIGG